MTTGSYNKDDRLTYQGYSMGVGILISAGREHSKSWNGADWGNPVSPGQTKRPFSLAQEPADVSNGVLYPARIRGRTGRLPSSFYREDHAYSMTASELIGAPCAWEQDLYYNLNSSVAMGAQVASWSAIDLNWDGNDQNALLSRLREKVNGSSFHLGVTLAEGKMAMQMIASSATRLHSALRALKRGNIPAMYKALTSTQQGQRYNKFRENGYLHYDDFLARERKRGIFLSRKQIFDKDLSSIWLEAMYGWKPLVEDIYGGAQFLAERLENPDVHTVRARLRKVKIAEVASSNPTAIRLHNGRGEVSTNVIARIKSVNNAVLSGLADPLSVAWEVTPWSFVIDWVIPIGNYLEAASFSNSVSATYVVSTRKQLSWKGCSVIPGNSLRWLQLAGGYGEARQKLTFLTRQILTELPAARPQVQPLGEVFSWNRAANAVALLIQQKPRGNPHNQ